MSFFSKIFQASADAAKPLRSNILGVTGLSRSEVVAMYRRDGLFFKHSALSPAEQAVVQSRLGAIPGVAAPAVPNWMTPSLRSLVAYTDLLVEGRDSPAAREQLELAGFNEAAISEVERVVENVRVVFRAFASPPVTKTRTTLSPLSRAA